MADKKISLNNFFNHHQEKILRELREAKIPIKKKNIEKILHETSFSVRSEKYPKECPYYIDKIPCHDNRELNGELNCFLCACHEYESDEEIGGCEIYSPAGFFFKNPNLPKGKIWDCSDCYFPHSPRVVKKYLNNNILKLNLKSKYLFLKDTISSIKLRFKKEK